MVAICTGPAFTTDDAGNLILAGERRKANPSPCALKDANGIYTDPNGGVWTPDQVSYLTTEANSVQSGAQVTAGVVLPYPTFTKTFTNSTCWAVDMTIQCTWTAFAWVNSGATMWFEIGTNIDNPNVGGFSVVTTSQYYPAAGMGAPPYFDWLTTYTQVTHQFRLESHASRQVTFGARMNCRAGTGGTLQFCNYWVNGWGFAVS